MTELEQPTNQFESAALLADTRDPLRPFLLAALATSLVAGLVVVLRLIFPHEAYSFLVPTLFLIAVEAAYTTRWLHHPDRRQLNRGAYRLAEFIFIAVILRLLTWALTGGLPTAETLRSYLLEPGSFLDGIYFGYILCAFLVWERAIALSVVFQTLAISHGEAAFYTLPRNEQTRRSHDRPIDYARPQAFARFVTGWIGGGLLLGFFAALASVDLPGIAAGQSIRSLARLGVQPGILAALLVYFLLGLWLMSEARLLTMRARWLADGVEVQAGMLHRWRRATATIILAVALVAAFLPIGSTLGIATLVEGAFTIAFRIFQLLFMLLTIFLYFASSLLGIRPPGQEPELPAPESQPFEPPLPPPTAPSPMSELVIGTLFWFVVVAVAVVAILYFLRDRGIAFQPRFLQRAWAVIRDWLRRLWHGASRQATSVRSAVARRLKIPGGPGPVAGRPWRFIRVNALPPREQVRFFYLAAVRRATEGGVPRPDSETPSEYASELKANWPEAEAEIDSLTAAFLEARYSEHPFAAEDVSPVKEVWKRIRDRLRRRRRARADTGQE